MSIFEEQSMNLPTRWTLGMILSASASPVKRNICEGKISNVLKGKQSRLHQIQRVHSVLLPKNAKDHFSQSTVDEA